MSNEKKITQKRNRHWISMINNSIAVKAVAIAGEAVELDGPSASCQPFSCVWTESHARMSECTCGPGGAPRPESQRGPHKKGCPKRTGVRRSKDVDGDDSMKEADGDWVMEPSPERPPGTIMVIAERRKTPSGKHTEVELNAYDGVTHVLSLIHI